MLLAHDFDQLFGGVGVVGVGEDVLRRVVLIGVFVAAENRLLREALSRMLLKSGAIEVVGADLAESFHTDDLLREEADILLLSSRGNRNEDLNAVRRVRTAAPKVQILLIGVGGGEAEFLQCVRAGVHGYLPKEASAEDVVALRWRG